MVGELTLGCPQAVLNSYHEDVWPRNTKRVWVTREGGRAGGGQLSGVGRIGESAFALAGSAKVVVVAWLERRVWFAWHQTGRHRIFCGTSPPPRSTREASITF